MEFNDYLFDYAETRARMAMVMHLQGRKRIEALEAELKSSREAARAKVRELEVENEQLRSDRCAAENACTAKDLRINELESEIDALVDYKKSWLHEVAKNEQLRRDYANLIKKVSFPISAAKSNTADASKRESSEACNG
jgi:predicted nuclease with TOPRIM domain